VPQTPQFGGFGAGVADAGAAAGAAAAVPPLGTAFPPQCGLPPTFLINCRPTTNPIQCRRTLVPWQCWPPVTAPPRCFPTRLCPF